MEPLREIIRSWGAQARREFKKELNALTKTQRAKCIKLFRQGVPLEEAKKRAQSRRGPITKHYVGDIPLKEYCKQEGLEYKAVMARMCFYNLSPEQAVEMTKDKAGMLGRPSIYWYKGKPVSRVLNTSQYSSFAFYLDKYDCLVEEAVEYALERGGKGIGTGLNNLKHKMPDGRTFRSACIAEGLTYETVLALVSHKKMSYEAAIQYAKTHKGNKTKHILSSGESLRQACKRLGLSYNCTVYYLKGGKTCDEALKYYCRLKGVKYE